MSETIFNISKPFSFNYSKYRPKYPDDVAHYVINYVRGKSPENGKLDLMVEVGCGSGQATNVFAPHFKKVLATDVSAAQVRQAVEANEFDHVTYKVAPAEEIPVKDESADVVLSAESVHWFDLSKFLPECERVLKPGGWLAVIGYFLESIKPLGQTGSEIINGGSFLWDYLLTLRVGDEAEKTIDLTRKYEKLFKAVPWAVKHRCDDLKIEYQWNLAELGRFEQTLGTYQNYVRHHADIIKDGDLSAMGRERLSDKVRRFLGVGKDVKDEDVQLNVVFNEFIILAQVP